MATLVFVGEEKDLEKWQERFGPHVEQFKQQSFARQLHFGCWGDICATMVDETGDLDTFHQVTDPRLRSRCECPHRATCGRRVIDSPPAGMGRKLSVRK